MSVVFPRGKVESIMKIKKGDLVKYGTPPRPTGTGFERSSRNFPESETFSIETRRHWRGIVISEVNLEDSIETVLVRWYKGVCAGMEFREKIKYLKVLDKASLTETK